MSVSATYLLPPTPNLLVQLKIPPCGNCRLTFPSGVLPEKPNLGVFLLVEGNYTQWECTYLPDTRPTFYRHFAYGVKSGFVRFRFNPGFSFCRGVTAIALGYTHVARNFITILFACMFFFRLFFLSPVIVSPFRNEGVTVV